MMINHYNYWNENPKEPLPDASNEELKQVFLKWYGAVSNV